MATILRVENITVRYGALIALQNLSWSVLPGEILGIIGPNGAGKSSCFAAVTNSVPHTGKVYLQGEDVSALTTDVLALLGLRRTFQQNSFFGDLSVLQNAVAAILAEHSTGLTASIVMPWREARTRQRAESTARALLESFGIGPEYHGRRPTEIPYGIQRLLSVVMAYGLGTQAVLLDEPAAGMGGEDMKRLAQLLLDIKARGAAVVLIEHHMDLIMNVADRIIVIDQGRFLAEGTPTAIQNNASVLDAYLGHAA
jgi:branched-chain amino acid transport system ATP-binding protein